MIYERLGLFLVNFKAVQYRRLIIIRPLIQGRAAFISDALFLRRHVLYMIIDAAILAYPAAGQTFDGDFIGCLKIYNHIYTGFYILRQIFPF